MLIALGVYQDVACPLVYGIQYDVFGEVEGLFACLHITALLIIDLEKTSAGGGYKFNRVFRLGAAAACPAVRITENVPENVAEAHSTILYLAGVMVYFYPIALLRVEAIGLVIACAGVLANALSSILGRHVNRSGELEPMAVTVVSMGVGAAVLLAGGVAVQGLPHLTLTHWAIILWLAVVNTAVAFTLWNYTLRTLSAMESSIINNTMLFQIAVLAWVFLGEGLAWHQMAGMILAALGTLLVQLRRWQAPENS